MSGGTFNQAIIIGNLGDAARITRLERGDKQTVIANFSLATSERIRKGENEFEEVTTWHNCIAFGRLAEVVQQYTQKGDKLHVVGRIQKRKYVQDNVEKTSVEILVNELNLLGKAPAKSDSAAAAAAASASSSGFGDFESADNPFFVGNSVPA